MRGRLDLMRRFAAFTGQYPWQWDAAEAEAWFVELRSGAHPIVFSTARIYQNTLRQFLEYLTDTRYRWPGVCLERFGVAPTQVLHEHNMISHVAEFEGGPARRPLTYDEVQALFDAADGRVETIRASRRKGALAALRDAVLLKTVYAFGLRRREACGPGPGRSSPQSAGRAFRPVRRAAGAFRQVLTAAPRPGARCCWCRRWTGSSGH